MKRKVWTTIEEELLKVKYPDGLEEELCALFKTSWHGIKLKAHKLGIKYNSTININGALADYNSGVPLVTLLEKNQLKTTTLYRHLRKQNNSKRNAPNFTEEFPKDYLTLPMLELNQKYNACRLTIHLKAKELGLVRPDVLIKKQPRSAELSKEQLLEEYINQNLTAQEIADKHGSVSRRRVNKLLRRFGIVKPTCTIRKQIQTTKIIKYGSASVGGYGKTENDIREWLTSLGFTFTSDVEILNGKEIDLYNADLKLGIEYCGLYWHTEDSPEPRDKSYHSGKFKLAKEKGVRLITIFEDEWVNRQEQVKGFLLSVLGKNSKIYARNCLIKEIPKSEAYKFYDAHHIQGAPHLSRTCAGLFYNDELVGAMSFGSHHRKPNITVLDRLCFKTGVSIAGGASRLFKFLFRKVNPAYVVSWSDNRWSQGAVYKALGFTLDAELGADYSYVKPNGGLIRFSKQSQKKSAVNCPPDKTELQWANERGLSRIWDCGKIRWRIANSLN